MSRIQLCCPTCGDVVLTTRSLAVSDGAYHFTCPLCANQVVSRRGPDEAPLSAAAEFTDADIAAFMQMLDEADWFDQLAAG